jgi:DNA-binding beta-propeller fold protein YncE
MMNKGWLMNSLRIIVLALAVVWPGLAQALEARFVTAGDATLANPHDIVLSRDKKLLYVSDLGHNRIAVLDTGSLKIVGEIGAGALAEPHDVAFGPDNALYVADTKNHRIAIYRVNGKTGRYVGEIKGPFRAPEGVAVHPNGMVYVAGAWSGNVVAFRDGKMAGELKGLSSPHDLVVTKSGDLWLADAGNDRVVLLTQDLKIKRQLKGKPYKFSGPRYLDLMADGGLIVADKYTHSVKFIGADGALIKVLGTGRAARGPGLFTTPEGVARGGADLWLADSGNNRIVRYRLGR